MSDSLFLDSAWGLGAAFRELAHGRDCPLNAAFADTHSLWGGEGAARTHPNSVCVFERDPGAPSAKHYDSLHGYYESVRGGELVVRFSSEGFYEHVVDLVLSVDGTLRVDVTKAGVAPLAPLEHAVFSQQSGGFARGHGGPRVALDAFAGADRGGATAAPLPYVSAVVFKADLDIGAAREAGANNSVQLHRLTHARRSAARGFGTGRPSPTVDVHTPEAEVAVPAAHLAAVIPVVVAEGETALHAAPRNPPRGYAIRVHGSASGVPPLLDAGEPDEGLPVGSRLSFIRWPFVATTRREDEAVGSVPYLNAWYGTPGAPRWGLGGYVQPAPDNSDACGGSPPCAGDRLRHSDVVAWVSSAGVYVPSLEWEPAFPVGLPVLGFTLAPFNWAAENPATDMADAVVVKVVAPRARGVPGGRGSAVGADEPLHRVAEFVENAAEVCRPRVERVPFLAHGFEA